MTTEIAYIPLEGGEDLITPSMLVKSGRALVTQNYELNTQNRYRLIDGYEAFDGRTKPSQASYWVLYFTGGRREIKNGDIVSGVSATGKVVGILVDSGNWATQDAAGHIAIYGLSGSFADNEPIKSTRLGALAHAFVDGKAVRGGAPNDYLDITYQLASIEAAREDIAAVPGSGVVLGGFIYQGVKYAFRNNATVTAAVLHKSSSSGWVVCDLGRTVGFTGGGTYEIAEDDEIEGASSSATATVKRVIVTSGAWSTGDAAGVLVLYDQIGTFQAENLNVGANLDVATIAGNSTATTLPVGGRYETVEHNFYGHTNTKRIYGVNGAGKAFEWDGETFVPITTGMTEDKPNHIIAHKNHLFLAFPGGSLQHSSTGIPYLWTVVLGAAEMGIGDEITGFLSLPNVLAVFARNKTGLLYGNNIDDWDFRPHSDESGAIEWTAQRLGAGIYLDDRGITSLSATDAYGDFAANSISKYIDPYLKTVMGQVTGSTQVKSKNQYRLFLTGGAAITMTFEGDKLLGITRQSYGKQVSCVWSGENETGVEEIFFGSTDGFVYQMDSGTSFNGKALRASITFHPNHLKTPATKKRIRKLELELDAPISTYLSLAIEFDNGQSANPSQIVRPDAVGGQWDVSSWDAFVWDGGSSRSVPVYVDGTGRNFALTIFHSGEWELQTPQGLPLTLPFVFAEPREGITGAQPHTLQGIIVHYEKRGLQR